MFLEEKPNAKSTGVFKHSGSLFEYFSTRNQS